MKDDKSLGQIAFEAYDADRGGVNFRGDPTPSWGALPGEICTAWEVQAVAIVDEVERRATALAALPEADQAAAEVEDMSTEEVNAALRAAGHNPDTLGKEIREKLAERMTGKTEWEGWLKMQMGWLALDQHRSKLETARNMLSAEIEWLTVIRAGFDENGLPNSPSKQQNEANTDENQGDLTN